ncbi:hypothetical protein HRI_001384500 [Hibiscus trionum]|uniref:Uncharacterized protein n=1 Tax=Hibiscus trionum TaxID=183268 RepID=A0A9W7HGT3_HIBTR|nr:hypothetical protein HRI_001384500 [Hibiscus trionum]
MESSCKGGDMEFALFDVSDVEFMGNANDIMLENYEHNETAANFSKEIGSGNPTLAEAPNMPNAPSPSTRDDRPPLDPMNANPGTFGLGNDRLVSSPGSTNDSFLPKPNPGQADYSGFGGNGSSLGHYDAASPVFSPLIMEQTHSFPMALAEKLPQNGDYSPQSFHSKHGVQTNQAENGGYSTQSFHSEHVLNSLQTNQVNGHVGLAGYSTQPLHSEYGVNLGQTNEDLPTQASHSVQSGSSLQAELLGSQRVESSNQGKTIMLADRFQQNNENNNFSDIHHPNSLTQSSSEIGYLNGGSRQINQQAPTWVSNKDNHFYRPLAPAGQQFLQFQATDNSDPQRHNFEPPRPSASLRAKQLNNPRQLLNQVPNMPNASNSLLQFMPRLFSYQRNQVAIAPRAYNPQTYSTRLPESSMRLRTPIRPTGQTNPLGVSDLQYLNSLQSKVTMLPSGRSILEDSNEQRHHQFDPFSPMRNQFGTHSSNSMLQEALMHSSSYKLPAHQQASSQFSMMSGLPNSDNHNPMLTETSFLPRLQQQGLQNQTARPGATFPTSGTCLSSTVLNSLLPKETGDTSAPHRMETSLRGHRERGNSGRRRGHSRRRFEPGESSSSPFKQFRRASSLPQSVSAEQENGNEAGTSSITDRLLGPRPIKNAVYDPIYEGIGLPIDPHLRIFATI